MKRIDKSVASSAASGPTLLPNGSGVLTHCNAGGLATAEYGTALAVIFSAHAQGKRLHVFVDETRPLLQGARLTTWELLQRGIPTTLICDSMAAQVMREGRVQAVITGADRIAANGDVANKIGTYGLAVLADAHQIPFYVAAPASTFDLSLASGEDIPIEQRSSREVTHGFGVATAPEGVPVYNPAFDVTPARLRSGDCYGVRVDPTGVGPAHSTSLEQQDLDRKGQGIMIKVGVVGLGMMGLTHLDVYRQRKDVRVVAICDSDPARLSGKGAGSGKCRRAGSIFRRRHGGAAFVGYLRCDWKSRD